MPLPFATAAIPVALPLSPSPCALSLVLKLLCSFLSSDCSAAYRHFRYKS